MLPCPRAALVPRGFGGPAGTGRAGHAGLGRPGWPGWPGASRAGLGWPGLARQGRLGLPGLAVRPVCVCSTGLARPARLAWPGPSGPSEKQKIKNVKVSKMAATAAIFDTLTFLIFCFELEGQRGKRAGLYLFPFNPTNEKLPLLFLRQGHSVQSNERETAIYIYIYIYMYPREAIEGKLHWPWPVNQYVNECFCHQAPNHWAEMR